jgi:glycosyltransferase involved in cell wall biosynthesis
MKVSVIIPCYKQAHFLKDAIASVTAQTYKDIEIIVVNDGSPDNTTEVANKLGARCIEKQNGGLSSARNAGIKAASGEIILPLDADDKIHPEFIEKTLKHIKKYDIISTYLETFGKEKRVWGSNHEYPNLMQMRGRNHINCCSLFRKSMWEKVGGYDEGMRIGFEDWEFWLRCLENGFNIKVLPEILFYYRKHEVSMLRDAWSKRGQILEYMKAKQKKYGVDVVIPLGTGSISANNELRFCLRSIEKHLVGYDNIWIVGHLPKWVQNVRHVPHGEYHPKALNIFDKIMAACEIEEISHRFIMFNDDYFLLQSVDAGKYFNYCSDEALQEVMKRSASNPYRQLTEDTMKVVGEGFKYADIHCPIVIDKHVFKSLKQFEPKRYENGLLVKSLYMAQINGTKMERKDPIVRGPKTTEELESMELTTDMLSIHDEAVNKDFINWVQAKFPVASQYER